MQVRTNPAVVPTEVRALPAAQPQAVPAPKADADDLSEVQIALVKRALELCFYTYWAFAAAKKKLGNELKYSDVECFDRRCMQAICFTDGEFAYLNFRGSESLGDWGYNFAALPWFHPRRHLGFEAGWRCLRGAVMGWLERLDRPNVGLVLTGHSLGGAIAQLAALDLARHGRRISNVVTFGAPKVAFLSSARAYDAAPANMGGPTLGALTVRIVNQGDLVPRLPPRLLGFRHVGRGIFIDLEDRLHVGVETDSMQPDLLMKTLDVNSERSESPLPGLVRHKTSPWQSKRDTTAGGQLLAGLLNAARAIPPLLLPVLYFRALLEVGRCGVDHMSARYWRAFFGNTKPPIDPTPKRFWTQFWRQLPMRLVVVAVALAALAGFFWVCRFTFRAIPR